MSEATYGQQIVAARKEMRITQKELAARVGISQQYLCDIEHDRRDVSPSGAVAEAIAYHAGVRSWTPGERALAARVADLERALELATARYRAAEEMLVDNMPEDWLVRATGHHTFDALWATDSEWVESMRLEARALLGREA
jgi:transcriptional regulator with XRE-family HTH domain